MTPTSVSFIDLDADPPIRGFFHAPLQPNGDAFVLTHGAGANCQSKLLTEMSNALSVSGYSVLRFDLPFRQVRPHGPPSPSSAARDRQGLRRAAAIMREKVPGRIFLGGHSYGGRQATIFVSEEPQLVSGLLLLSYPLHPPKKPTELRTSHFPKLFTPALFVHGTNDPFGTIEEMKTALKLIPAAHGLLEIDRSGHDLLPKKTSVELPERIVKEFQIFLEANCSAGTR
jgi:uncharacterized protein